MQKQEQITSKPISDTGAEMSIGELARRTGLGVLRIRAWENRYGIPTAHRTASGHRRYGEEEALRLELVAHAVQSGYRIGSLAKLKIADLKQLLGQKDLEVAPEFPWTETCILLARQGDEARLRSFIAGRRHSSEWLAFVQDTVVPLLEAIGTLWEAGSLAVAEEHFATGVLESFLEEEWRLRNLSNTEGPLVLTLLPGDEHTLGLHLCALAAVHAGKRVIWLGARTPAASMVAAVAKWEAKSLCVSVSVTYPWTRAQQQLVALSKALPVAVRLYVGGAGVLGKIKGVQFYNDLGRFSNELE